MKVRLMLLSLLMVLCVAAPWVLKAADANIEFRTLAGDEIKEWSIQVPFSEADLWKEAVRRLLASNYWGDRRAYISMNPGEEPVLCRTLTQTGAFAWFREFASKSEEGSESQVLEPQYELFIETMVRALGRPVLTLGACGTDSQFKSAVTLGGAPATFFWTDAVGQAAAKLCWRTSSWFGNGDVAEIQCVPVSGEPTISPNNREYIELRSELIGEVESVVEIDVDGNGVRDLCTVNVAQAVRERSALLREPVSGPLPHGISSGSLVLPGGERVSAAQLGFLTCARRSLAGNFEAGGAISYPLTWIGQAQSRMWADIDADGRTDFCRAVPAIGPSTTEVLLLCTLIQDGKYGSTSVDLIELD